MFYHLITTNKCNLNCKYCCEKAFDEPEEFPEEMACLNNNIEYTLKDLTEFLKNDKNPTITFYGGEPLLNPKYIMQVMDNFPNVRFMMQTNGLLLKVLPSKYLNKFHTLLISIDGNEKTTDYYRGNGVYKKVMENIKHLKNNSFCGELIARMTIEDQNIYDSVLHLLKNVDFCFTSVHWQIDANFWFNDWKNRDFKKWVNENYLPNVKKLVDFWITEMKRGTVIKLYPFLGITNTLLFGEDLGKLKCGAGHENFAIQTDGNISPCPIMMGMKKYYLGNIKTSKTPKTLIILAERCKKCKILDICGGRCMYSNILNPWPKDQTKLVCKTVKTTVSLLKSKIPTIKKLIEQGIIYKKNFLYEKYNGAEIIP